MFSITSTNLWRSGHRGRHSISPPAKPLCALQRSKLLQLRTFPCLLLGSLRKKLWTLWRLKMKLNLLLWILLHRLTNPGKTKMQKGLRILPNHLNPQLFLSSSQAGFTTILNLIQHIWGKNLIQMYRSDCLFSIRIKSKKRSTTCSVRVQKRNLKDPKAVILLHPQQLTKQEIASKTRTWRLPSSKSLATSHLLSKNSNRSLTIFWMSGNAPKHRMLNPRSQKHWRIQNLQLMLLTVLKNKRKRRDQGLLPSLCSQHSLTASRCGKSQRKLRYSTNQFALWIV